MAVARFLFVSGRLSEAPTAWPVPAAMRSGDAWFAWRLVGGNNRELGRSACLFGTLGEAQVSAREASLLGATARPLLAADAATGSWSWRLSVDGRTVAVAARTYRRQRECHYNVAQFAAACEIAATAADVLILPSQRSTRIDAVEVAIR